MPYGYLYDGTQDVPPRQDPKVPVDAIDVSSQQTISGGNQYVPPAPQPYGYLYDGTQDTVPRTPDYQVPQDAIEVYFSITISGGNPATFSISGYPPSITVVQGNTGNTIISTIALNGFNSSIALSDSGLPSGVTAAFSPTSISAPGTGTSTLTFTVGGSVTVGSYTITVTGTGGSVTTSTTVILNVVASSGSTGTGIFVTQIPIETSIAPSDAKIRITQIPVETSIQPSDAKVRVTQLVIETSIVYSTATQLLAFDDDTQTPLNQDYYPGIQQDELGSWTAIGVPFIDVDSADGQHPMQVNAFDQASEDVIYIPRRQPRVWITIT